MGRIIMLSGPPGAGKTTLADRLSRDTGAPHSLHLHTDDLYGYVRKGYVAPWRPEATNQNLVLVHALAATAAICAKGGYEVYADGIVGPAFLPPWVDAARTQALELHYVVLMPDEATAVGRAVARTDAMNDREIAQLMWRRFAGYEFPAGALIDTTAQRVEETAAAVREGVAAGRFRVL